MPGIIPAPPFERRVIQRLARGLETIVEAVAENGTGPIISSTEKGFSANMCEQFASLVDHTAQGGITFDFAFSPEWKVDQQSATMSRSFFVTRTHVEIIQAAAKELRAQVQSWPETVFGRVIRLATDADPSDFEDLMGEREVAILWSSEELGDITVRALLDPADYMKAVQAHAAGRAVEVSGTLERRPRRWILTNPTNLTLHA